MPTCIQLDHVFPLGFNALHDLNRLYNGSLPTLLSHYFSRHEQHSAEEVRRDQISSAAIQCDFHRGNHRDCLLALYAGESYALSKN